jgi:hypothetical protein
MADPDAAIQAPLDSFFGQYFGSLASMTFVQQRIWAAPTDSRPAANEMDPPAPSKRRKDRDPFAWEV